MGDEKIGDFLGKEFIVIFFSFQLVFHLLKLFKSFSTSIFKLGNFDDLID